jgi:hypothetical protein
MRRATKADCKMQEEYPQLPEVQQFQGELCVLRQRAIQRGVYNGTSSTTGAIPSRSTAWTTSPTPVSSSVVRWCQRASSRTSRSPCGLQPDYALGFVRSTGDAGHAALWQEGAFHQHCQIQQPGLARRRGTGPTSPPSSGRFLVFCPGQHPGPWPIPCSTAPAPRLPARCRCAGLRCLRASGARARMSYAPRSSKPLIMYGDQALLHGSPI